jgi:hypothetical protein
VRYDEIASLDYSLVFLRYAPFKNQEKPRKTNKNQVGTNKNLFFLVCFCFYWFLKGAERKSSFIVKNSSQRI